MHNLVLFFLRFGHYILFALLEFLCLYLIVTYNHKQKEIWANSSNIMMGFTSEKWNDWTNYLSLRDNATILAKENAKLKEKLINFGLRHTVEKDSLDKLNQQYVIIPAKVINISTNRSNNYITLNKGEKDGIRPGMGVISNNGIVGIIRNVSEYYAQVNSILHRRSFISATFKRTGAYGDLRWIKSNPRYCNLMAIEKHHSVEVGDTILTSGFSTHFPSGIMIGKVQKTELLGGSNFHVIEVLLNNDFSSLRSVYIIKNAKQEQQLDLEKEVANE